MSSQTACLGILGGMGPLASAEFVATLYRLHLREPEQDSPACLLLSDPTFPDRTKALLEGRTEVLRDRLEGGVRSLLAQGATRVVIACVTLHALLPELPTALRAAVVSLVDVVLEEVLAAPQRRLLLLATIGTRRVGIFERHPFWPSVAERILTPSVCDQQLLHEWIYRLKAGEATGPCLGWLVELERRYEADGLIFGCTEFHLLQRALEGQPGALRRRIDPLWSVARDLPALMLGEAPSLTVPILTPPPLPRS